MIESKAASVVGGPIGLQPNNIGVQPNNVVTGDCGTSDFYLAIFSNGTFSSTTGYTVRTAVDSKQWHTYLQDPSGSVIAGTVYDSGPSGPTWSANDGPPPDLSERGQYLGGVDIGIAYLVDGTTCYSGDPAEVANYWASMAELYVRDTKIRVSSAVARCRTRSR